MSAFSILPAADTPEKVMARLTSACLLTGQATHLFRGKKGNSLKLQVMLQLTIFFLVYNFLSCLQFFTKMALMESFTNWVGMGPSFAVPSKHLDPFLEEEK